MSDKAPPDPQFEALLRYIQDSRNLDFRGYKRSSLTRRITLRMRAVGVEDFAAYQAHLEVHPREFDHLLDAVLINVTSFFRDPEAWEALAREIVPQIVARAGAEGPIRIWSAGCASGEEPYTLAMVFAEALGVDAFCNRVKLYGTDLDEEALRAARAATYLPRDVESVPPALLERYFERTNNHFVFNREIRKCVIFGRHNVVKDAPISRIDLLVCRNLLIYLEAETQDIVLPRLHYALVRDGFLFLGKAETQLARSAQFMPVAVKQRIFAKQPQEWRRTPGGGLALTRPPRAEPTAAQLRLFEAVLNETEAAYLVIDGNGNVVLANTAARRLLSVGEADIGRLFQDLAISYRPHELRGPIDEAMRQQRTVRIEHQEYHLGKGEVIRITIDIKPLSHVDGNLQAVLLAFTDTTAAFNLQRELQVAQDNLENTIEELQSTNEELETTNEELQSTNEELETINEELQSTNEELETINEESRSSNEEMESANEELRIQAQQAQELRLHMEAILRSLELGLVVIDDRRLVRSWNRWSENTWGLRAEEVAGESFEALEIGFPVHRLREALAAVESGQSAEAVRDVDAVDRRGRPITCRVRISPLVAEGQGIAGTVLAFADVSAEARREEYERYLGRVVGRALNEIYFLDPATLRFVLVNHGAEVKLGAPALQLAQMTLADFLPEAGIERLRQLIGPLITGDEPEIVFETTIQAANGRRYPAEICVQYFGRETPHILVAMVHDVSERRTLRAG